MVSTRKWIAALPVLVIAWIAGIGYQCQTALCQEGLAPIASQLSDAPLEIACRISLAKGANAKFSSGEIHLGELPLNKKIRVALAVVNEGDVPIRFATAKSHCDCEHFLIENRELAVGESVAATFAFSTPPTSRSADRLITVELQDEAGRVVVHLALHYRLRGLLAFAEPMGQLEIRKGQALKDLQLALVASPPLETERIHVELSPGLSDFKARIIDQGGRPHVQLTSSPAARPNHSLAGEIRIEDLNSGISDTYQLIVKLTGPCSLSPSLARFRRDGDGVYRSVAILKIHGLELTERGERSETGESHAERSVELRSIHCCWGKHDFDIESKQIGRGIYRLRISIEQAQLKQLEDEVDLSDVPLRWTINGMDFSEVIEIPAFFSK